MSLSVRVPRAVLQGVSVLSSRATDGTLVSEEDGAGDFAVRRLQGVGGVDGLVFAVVPTEHAHLKFRVFSRATGVF